MIPWSTYEFRVAAANVLGYGIYSSPSPQYNTPPDKPHRAPVNIGGGGGKIGDLTIAWQVGFTCYKYFYYKFCL